MKLTEQQAWIMIRTMEDSLRFHERKTDPVFAFSRKTRGEVTQQIIDHQLGHDFVEIGKLEEPEITEMKFYKDGKEIPRPDAVADIASVDIIKDQYGEFHKLGPKCEAGCKDHDEDPDVLQREYYTFCPRCGRRIEK